MPQTLDDLRDLACEQLTRAAREPGHPFRWPVFATVDTEGRPAVRTVVLREFSSVPGHVIFFTDLRSPKLSHLRARFRWQRPVAEWLAP